MIFFYHWFFHYVESLPLLIRAPFEVGYVSVSIFFALSGFLITYRYYRAFQWHEITFGRYLTSRLVRIYPLYVVILTLFVIAFGRPDNMMPDSVPAFIAVYTMTQALFPDLLHIGTTVGWTLTIEMIFYLLAPTLMAWLGQGKPFGVVVIRAVLASAVALAAGLLLARLPLTRWLPNSLIGAPDSFILHYSVFGHLANFVVGMVAAFALLRRNVSRWLARYARMAIWVGVAGAWICIIVLDTLQVELGSLTDWSLTWGAALFTSLIAAAIVCDEKRANPITWLLSTRPVVYLGSLSYALFLIQLTEPCQWMYWIFLGEVGAVEHRIWRAVLLYGIAIALSAALYQGVEKPARHLLRRMVRDPSRKLQGHTHVPRF
jgi:peptidoglycan/LPS O-acetylase OafA/YrhL